ncbi:MAG: hypothetical protein KDI36_12620 [Pseudomonadales bacterium]|nr:hypothetical protein [Pseudomonadales bacterium]
MVDESIDKEVDLKDLLRAVFNTRVWVVSGLIIVTALFWTSRVFLNIKDPTIFSYESRISLTFKGVDEGKYPNGSPFAMSDIVAPVVLNRVYDASGVSQYLERQAFVGAFSVKPYTPDRDFILEKFNGLLESGNLTTAEINELQEELNSELSKAASDGVALSFSGTELDNIPRNLIDKLLYDVIAEWARHMIEDVGVADFDREIYTSAVVDEKLLSSIDYLIAFEMLLDRLNLLQSNVEKIKAMPNGMVARDGESNLKVPDLEKAISDIQKYQVAPLINPIKSLGIAKDPEIVKLYFENELVMLARQKLLLEGKRNNISKAYQNYVGTEKSSNLNSASQLANGGNGGSMIPQFGSEFLDRIVEMTNAGADLSYRQMLNGRELEISDELSEVESEIRRIEEILESISGVDQSTQELRRVYSERVNEELPVIVEQLKYYFSVSVRIYQKLSREDLGGVGSMYRYVDGDVIGAKSRSILSPQNIQTYVILLFLTVVLIVPLAMIRSALRRSDSTD